MNYTQSSDLKDICFENDLICFIDEREHQKGAYTACPVKHIFKDTDFVQNYKLLKTPYNICHNNPIFRQCFSE